MMVGDDVRVSVSVCMKLSTDSAQQRLRHRLVGIMGLGEGKGSGCHYLVI